jgi:hypothetical protein
MRIDMFPKNRAVGPGGAGTGARMSGLGSPLHASARQGGRAGGGTRRVQSVREEGQGVSSQYGREAARGGRATAGSARLDRRNQIFVVHVHLLEWMQAGPFSTGGGTRHVQLVRGEGRDVSSLYRREGGGGQVDAGGERDAQ